MARAVQGGAALLAPAALSLIAVTYSDPKELCKTFVIIQHYDTYRLTQLRVVWDRNRGASDLAIALGLFAL